MAESKASPRKVKAAARRLEALRLRRQGLTYDEIGAKLGISRPRAYQIVSEAYKALKQEGSEVAEQLLAVNLERLDSLLAGVWDKARQGQKDAVEAALKIIDRQARMAGLDAPTKTESTHRYSNLTDAELKEEARRLGVPVAVEAPAENS